MAEALAVLVASLGPELTRTEGFGMAPFRYLPHVLFVKRYGLDCFEASMRAQHELTKRYSAEYSIRAFLLRHPDATYERLRSWASDANVHDIGKDHPELLVDICRRWAPGRDRLVRHALRSLVKRGHAGALGLLGFGGRPRVEVAAVELGARSVRIGSTLRFSCELISTAREDQELLVDYAVHS